ncbi:MAG TPA: twin-arginine translocation signal domain-containing protein, partial [Candidatus Limnocylindrales bacterium]|nr:twin-arginine translocation signal domain-containing protein [Candidatus Limnocylindrales bacterium]
MNSGNSPGPECIFSRRTFLKNAAVASCGIALGGFDGFGASHPSAAALETAVTDLPAGAAPPALQFRHFPSRLHAFVWRNWPLVPIARIAQVVGARTSDLERMGRAMGLGKPPRITNDQQARSYITVIKRNWHLLPYNQLVALLGWTPAQLVYTLREDDFLFVKLGNLKPACQPLRYEMPGPEALRREQEIASVVRETFPAGACQSNEPLFGFVSELSHQRAACVSNNAGHDLRFCYSYFALYGDPLLDTKADPYPDGYLARLAELGVNGVWLQAVLYKLAPFPWQPGLSSNFQRRLSNLNRLVTRSARFGIKIFLYLNEPRAMPLGFFDNHVELKGASEGDHAALCTSVPEVQRYLIDSIERISTAVPGLGGFFTITASENFTNCWSHGGGAQCPRCSKRSAAEVIAEVNSLILEGIRAAKTAARLIAWDWGWD